MASVRFPGKSFFLLDGLPTLAHLVESLLINFRNDQILVVTSHQEENDVIRKYCSDNEITSFSGDENNVASRYYNVLSNHHLDYFVRISGDSPLFCSNELKHSIEKITKDIYFDGYSTVINRNYPKGNNFEIFNAQTFLTNYSNFYKPSHFEHVTSYFYDHFDRFRINEVKFAHDGFEDVNFCFDTEEDCLNLLKIFKAMEKPHYEYLLIEKCYLYRNLVKKI